MDGNRRKHLFPTFLVRLKQTATSFALNWSAKKEYKTALGANCTKYYNSTLCTEINVVLMLEEYLMDENRRKHVFTMLIVRLKQTANLSCSQLNWKERIQDCIRD